MSPFFAFFSKKMGFLLSVFKNLTNIRLGNNLRNMRQQYEIRQLSIECERLMGFPDNWTRIVWKGKLEEQCPDAPRYKACGNSMCVNVMMWLGERIDEVNRKIPSREGIIENGGPE